MNTLHACMSSGPVALLLCGWLIAFHTSTKLGGSLLRDRYACLQSSREPLFGSALMSGLSCRTAEV